MQEKILKNYYKPIKDAFKNNYIEYERRGGKDKNLSLEDYLDITRPFLTDMINNYIQLAMWINFISSLDTGEIFTMNSKSDNVEIMMGIETDV